MAPYKRHDLVWLSEAGKAHALSNVQNCVPPVKDDEIRALIFSVPPIPAIVRRQEAAEEGLLCIGFSSPKIIDGIRLRIGSRVPPDCIVRLQTPFDVAKSVKAQLPDCGLLNELIDAGLRHNTEVGVFGSAALQLVTGLPYMRENSDMDIYLRCHGTRQDLTLFFGQLLKYEEKSGISIDAEIEWPGQYGVKLKELFGPGKTVLGKGLYDVAILEKPKEGSSNYAN